MHFFISKAYIRRIISTLFQVIYQFKTVLQKFLHVSRDNVVETTLLCGGKQFELIKLQEFTTAKRRHKNSSLIEFYKASMQQIIFVSEQVKIKTDKHLKVILLTKMLRYKLKLCTFTMLFHTFTEDSLSSSFCSKTYFLGTHLGRIAR